MGAKPVIVLGLTGSIGMGKSEVAKMFRARNVPVFDADAAVARLYAQGGAAAGPVAAAFPEAVRAGAVDRAALSRLVVGQPEALSRLEAIVHPLVRAAEEAFLAAERAAGTPLAVLEIPLLFEGRNGGRCDRIAVVSAPPGMQRRRVLARPGMTEAKFDALLARQTPDVEKRRSADFVIDTSGTLAATDEQVQRIIAALVAGS
jgi:dephospho-CoA kinase